MQGVATARVALESTLLAHGLPWPENLQTARASEAAVRDAGALPETIALIQGRIRVGLTDSELQQLAEPRGDVWKAGRRDLAAALALGRDAATTVSATAFLARRAGIGVMATGGLGGVHRHASRTLDVSTDLDELARADGLVVVCSGVKSILDVPATLERLESLGVAIIGYQTSQFPAFTCRSSGIALEVRADSVAQVVAIVQAHRELGLPGAIVVAQPVPEALALDPNECERAIESALQDAEAAGLSGKAITPFLLDRVKTATAGRSLAANRTLIVENARLAGELAAALETLDQG